MELIFATVREKQTYFHLPRGIAQLAAKPREFLLRRVRDKPQNPWSTAQSPPVSCAVPAHANMHMLCGMHHRPRWKQHVARAAFRAGIPVAQGIAIPSHTMFTEDYLRESVVDNILSSASGDLTFADLGISPQRVDIGLPIEHVRHFRIGGGSLRFPPSTRCFGWLCCQNLWS